MLTESVELHCIGGFAIIHAYGVARTTNDLDFISLVPNPRWQTLSDLVGEGSELHKKYKVYLEAVAVTTAPDDDESRLQPLFPEDGNP
jgi:hypothetical protein